MTSPQLRTRNNYNILDPLGKGASGQVFKILVHEDGKTYALKHVELNPPNQEIFLADAKTENSLFRKGIPNVLKSFGSHHEPNKCFIFSTELMDTTLEKFIDNKGPLTFENFLPIFKDIITGRINIFFL
jgi:serine/threonine protein kinase